MTYHTYGDLKYFIPKSVPRGPKNQNSWETLPTPQKTSIILLDSFWQTHLSKNQKLFMDQKFLVYCQTKLVGIHRSEICRTGILIQIFYMLHVTTQYTRLVHATSSCSAITERNARTNLKKICQKLWPLECSGKVFKYRSKLVLAPGSVLISRVPGLSFTTIIV